MAVFGQSYSFRDDKGQVGKVLMYITDAAPAGALTKGSNIYTALQALTNAAPDGARGAYTAPPAAHTFGADADYESVESKAILTFQTSVGSIHKYQIPAPLETLFEADGETVKTPDGGGDAQQILLNTFVTAMVAGACSRDGVAIASYVGGTFIRRKMQRRFNVFTRNPALTGPGL